MRLPNCPVFYFRDACFCRYWFLAPFNTIRDKSFDFATCHIQWQTISPFRFGSVVVEKKSAARPQARQGCSKPITISLFTLMVPTATNQITASAPFPLLKMHWTWWFPHCASYIHPPHLSSANNMWVLWCSFSLRSFILNGFVRRDLSRELWSRSMRDIYHI